MPDLHLLKFMEEAIFQGYIINPKLLSDLDLEGLSDLRSDLRGQMRSLVKNSILLYFSILIYLNTFHGNSEPFEFHDLISDLQGQMRSLRSKMQFYSIFESYHSKQCLWPSLTL